MRPTESDHGEVDRYLRRLDEALTGLPPATATDIREGIAEELHNLDPATASRRISELGDPAFIATEARGGVTSGADTTPRSVTTTKWYAAVTGLVIAVGGIIVPVAGWAAGIVMLWLSPTWRRWQKWVATLSPVAIIIGAVLISVTAQLGGASVSQVNPSQVNPVIPIGPMPWWNTIVVALVANIAIGAWLLITGLSRAKRP